jgi:DHA1 family inner membrane transport protein
VPVRAPATLRLALAALGLGGFAIGTGEFVAMGLLPEVARGIRVSVPTAGHVVSAYALGVVVGAPLLAAVGARLPRRRLLVLLMAAFCVGNVLSALAPSYSVLVGARFFSGLPHGAFFGVASLVAADLADPGRRATAVARVLLGLSIANVVGVPAATWLGQALGWRAAFVAVAVLGAITVVSVLYAVPSLAADPHATVRRELGALRRTQVWFALAIGAIGGGGLFAVYSYISPILTGRSGVSSGVVPLALALVGTGMVGGSLLSGRIVDRLRPLPAMVASLAVMAGCFSLFAFTTTDPVLGVVSSFLLGLGVALPTALQVRLMDVAGDAQTLAAALNHSSFNAANALGAWLGGLVLAAGYGLAAPMWVAVGLSLAGILLVLLSALADRRPAQAAGTSRRGDPQRAS